MKGRKKQLSQRRHARHRAHERYGIDVVPGVRKEIIAKIRSGRSQPVETQSLRISVHDVEINGQIVRVVYDRQRKELVTFLPRTIYEAKPRRRSDYERQLGDGSVAILRGHPCWCPEEQWHEPHEFHYSYLATQGEPKETVWTGHYTCDGQPTSFAE